MTVIGMDSSSNNIAECLERIGGPAWRMVMAYLYVVECGDLTFLNRATGLDFAELKEKRRELERLGLAETGSERFMLSEVPMVRLTAKGRRIFAGAESLGEEQTGW